eukprot:jgi/Picsp_1/2360/NSC_05823-R1_---NA---
MALLHLKKYEQLFHISYDEFCNRKENEDALYDHVMRELNLDGKQTLRKHLNSYTGQDLKKQLSKAGYAEQESNIRQKNDLLDFIFGILFRVRYRRGEIEFCKAPNGGSVLKELLLEYKRVNQSRFLGPLLGKSDPKISYSAISRLTKREQWDRLSPYVVQQKKSKDELSDLLYGMLWLDDLSSENATLIEETHPSNVMNDEKTLNAFKLSTQGGTTTGPHAQQTLSRKGSTPNDIVRQLDFSNVGKGAEEIKSTFFRSRKVMIGHAKPRCCPAILTTNLQVCNTPCSIGAYCNRHRATHPRLLSSNQRMLTDLVNQMSNVLVCNGYEELTSDDPKEMFANVQEILMKTSGPPWDDFSTDFMACSETDMKPAIIVRDCMELQDKSTAGNSRERETSQWWMVTANINGKHSNCPERSNLIENVLRHTAKNGNNLVLLFLQEVNSKKIIEYLAENMIYPAKKPSEILAPYETVHHPELSTNNDVCILYNSTIFHGTNVTDELRRLKKRNIKYKLRKQRAFDRLESRFSAVRLTSRKASTLALLALSFHGFQSQNAALVSEYDTTDCAIKDLFQRVLDYIKVHNIPAIVGGDFNKKKDSLSAMIEELTEITGVTFEVQSPKDNAIDFFVFCYPRNSDQLVWTEGVTQMNLAELVSESLHSEHHRKLFDHLPVEARLHAVDGFGSQLGENGASLSSVDLSTLCGVHQKQIVEYESNFSVYKCQDRDLSKCLAATRQGKQCSHFPQKGQSNGDYYLR